MGFAERLKQARHYKKLKQSDLAREIGVTPNAISNYETGLNFPKEEVLLKIFDVLEITPNFLFQDSFNDKNLSFTKYELEIIKKYRSLDDHGKELVDTILDKEYERCNPGEEEMVTLRIAARSKDNSTGLQTVKVSKADMDAANDLLKIIPPSDPGV